MKAAKHRWNRTTRYAATIKNGMISTSYTPLYVQQYSSGTRFTKKENNNDHTFKRYYHKTPISLQEQQQQQKESDTSESQNSEDEELQALMNAPNESDKVDVVIVGGGPAGLSASIRLMQLAEQHDVKDSFRVVVLEKAADVGKHILSGAVIQPRALNELIHNWKDKNPPLMTPVTEDSFMYLTKKSSWKLPTPKQMHNSGNYIVSLADFTKWLGDQATDLGVEIYPESPAVSFVPFSPLSKSSILGVATGPKGVSRSGKPKSTYTPGFDFHAHLTILSEGARGSLTKIASDQFNLRDGIPPQTYGLGVKELWQIDPSNKLYSAGKVQHTIGWPLTERVYGGSWIYHLEGNLVSIGFVIGLDYENPWLNIYKEFQRFKHHPAIQPLLEGGTPIGYVLAQLLKAAFNVFPKHTFPEA